ncbi:MAG: hypothetical protein ABI451_05775 [Dokdonella sp.]
MNTPITRVIAIASVVTVMVLFALPIRAADGGSAKGALSVTGDGEPGHIEIANAYLVAGADSLEPNKIVRRVIFTSTDVRPVIEACSDADCAMYSIEEGMWIQLDDATMMSWWAKVKPVQISGMTGRSGLVLTTDKPDHLAGTLTLDTMGVKTRIEFDAPLVKPIPASE